ncbi:Tim10 [Symbiodinium sp. CCMP2456]|nr:Tim10 [Symbiodinium sp. CCMP2456]
MHKRKVVQYLSKYIRGLNADQVSSRLLSGEVELRDAELEVAPLQSLLASAGLPYTLEAARGHPPILSFFPRSSTQSHRREQSA